MQQQTASKASLQLDPSRRSRHKRTAKTNAAANRPHRAPLATESDVTIAHTTGHTHKNFMQSGVDCVALLRASTPTNGSDHSSEWITAKNLVSAWKLTDQFTVDLINRSIIATLAINWDTLRIYNSNFQREQKQWSCKQIPSQHNDLLR